RRPPRSRLARLPVRVVPFCAIAANSRRYVPSVTLCIRLRAVGHLTAPEYGWVSRHNNQSKKPAVLQPARTNSQLLVGFAASEFGRKTNHTRLLRWASPF